MGFVEILLVLGFVGLWVGSIVFWIMSLVEIAKIPDYQYKAARTEKLTWVLVVVLVGIIGAIIWRATKRGEVLRAAGQLPTPSPGWYPDPYGEGWRWWDGRTWTAKPQT